MANVDKGSRHYKDGQARGCFLAAHYNVESVLEVELEELAALTEAGPVEDNDFSRACHVENVAYATGVVDYLKQSYMNALRIRARESFLLAR